MSPDGGTQPEGGMPQGVPPGCDEALVSTAVTRFYDVARCLFEGDDAVQREADVAAFDEQRIAIVRGRVLDSAGQPLEATRVTVRGGEQYGHTFTRADGYYDLAVNGGGTLTLRFEKEGYLVSQRHERTSWRRFSNYPDVVLIPPAAASPSIELATIQEPTWAQGAPSVDDSGTRQHTVLVRPGTQARMRFADGSEQPLDTLDLRITEYTRGERGPQAMPGDLPAASAYTYAVDMAVVQAEEAGAERVIFEPALTTYVDNFLGFPAGTNVPNGYYDPERDLWEASENGLVITVLDVTEGEVILDIDGDAEPDDVAELDALGIDEAERRALAKRYVKGASLWRVPIPHFSSWDHNWGFGPPLDALAALLEVLFGSDDGLGPTRCGSIIGCEQQSLGERFEVVGTPYSLRYQSERMSGYKATRELDIRLSGPTVPPSLKRIELEVEILGQLTKQSFGPEPDQRTQFRWDGKDAYGRQHQGRQEVTIKVGYVYDGVYTQTTRFGEAGTTEITGDRTRQEVTLWSTATGFVGGFDQLGLDLGGFSLDIHHVYDPNGSALYQGDGVSRTVETLGDMIDTVAGQGTQGFAGDGQLARLAQLNSPHGLAVAADGTIYVSDEGNDRIRRIAPDGTISTYGGTGEANSRGDGGPALAAGIQEPLGLALASDGTLFVAQRMGLVRAISPDGTIRTFAGGGEPTEGNGDGGPATQARFGEPHALALASDGTLFVVDARDNLIRRIGTDGIISTIAGNSSADAVGDGGPATEAKLESPLGLAIGPDDSLFVTEYDAGRVRKISPSGIISTVAGTGDSGFSGDGGLATEARLSQPHTVDVAPDGTLYITDEGNRRVRRVLPDGTIDTIAGTGRIHNSGQADVGDQGPARSGTFNTPRVVYRHQDGTILIADYGDGRIRRVRPALPGYTLGESLIASSDGSQVFRFDNYGRHRQTLHALTGAVLTSFQYDDRGALIGIDDASGNRTQIQRDTDGTLTAIVGPFGHTTKLQVGSDKLLASIERPLGDVTHLEYAAGGLLSSLRRPRGNSHETTSFTYDELGRLLKDTHPTGLEQTLTREEIESGHRVTRALNEARREIFEVTRDDEGTVTRKHTAYDGLLTTTTRSVREVKVEGPLGNSASTQAGDPRFGLVSQFAANEEVRTGSLRTTIEREKRVDLVNTSDPFSLRTMNQTLRVNDRVFDSQWEGATRTLTHTSPQGRAMSIVLDEQGRISSKRIGSLAAMTYRYDTRGHLIEVAQGARVATLSYGTDGTLTRVGGPSGEDVRIEHDANRRAVAITYADGSRIGLGYDAQDAAISLAQPSAQIHGTPVGTGGLPQGYYPPLGVPAQDTSVTYHHDEFLFFAGLSDSKGSTLDITYDRATGRPTNLTHEPDSLSWEFNAATGLVSRITSLVETLAYEYNGQLPRRVTYSGAVRGNVSREYDANLWRRREGVNSVMIEYQHDLDGLLTVAGDQSLTRDAETGAITATALLTVSDERSVDEYGEVTRYAARAADAEVYTREDERDLSGRVISRTETVLGEQHAYEFEYDLRGRLIRVTRDGALAESYAYDGNDNRTSVMSGGTSLAATYGAGDQLLSLGDTSFAYDARGSLARREQAGQATQYGYDMRSQLRRVTLPDGTLIEYIIDPENRRVGKRVGGALQQGFLYDQNDRVVAEIGPNGSTVTARFVYASLAHSPDFMVKDGQTYRLISDALGSIRLVVNAADSTIAQRLSYDSFGRVIEDSNPGFQPFGFAGGLHDRDTGLVRFGARDYDPWTGRWTSRDPIKFRGGQANLYAYVNGDPINHVDPTGLWLLQAAGGLLGAGSQAYANYDAWKCGTISDGDYAASIAVGFGVGVLSTLPTSIIGGALAGAGGSAINEILNVGIGAKHGSLESLGTTMVLGGAGGAFANGIGNLGARVFKAESVFAAPLPLPPRQTYGEIGGAIGTAVGTIGTSWIGS